VLRGIIICPDEALAAQLEIATHSTGEISIGLKLNEYPAEFELGRIIRANTPDVVFLSFDRLEEALEVGRVLEVEAVGVQLIGIGRQIDQRLLRAAMRVGVREFLAEPFARPALIEAFRAVKALAELKPATSASTDQVFAFLPAKPGVGTSTIALNVSAAMARLPDTQVLLADFDLSSGLIRFMLKLENENSVTDALENSGRIDESLWPKMITAVGNLSVLHSGCINPSLRVETSQVRALTDFLRRNYQAVCFDLSGNMERYALEIMQDCKRILLVCTPETSSLSLGREKLDYLESCGLHTRVSAVLNRTQKKGSLSKDQAEEMLGIPVMQCFPNDYVTVSKAVKEGAVIAPRTALGETFVRFAKELMEGGQIAESAKSNRRFMEFFAPQRTDLALG
jgi:pilus assembly protein CpaE